ncbi:MAG: hypothetical protein Q8P77_03830 [Candidatus Veblenbacteria bacterium]|nr:hypothetical protein [Candidatus Veblenbacteria bacterium]
METYPPIKGFIPVSQGSEFGQSVIGKWNSQKESYEYFVHNPDGEDDGSPVDPRYLGRIQITDPTPNSPKND